MVAISLAKGIRIWLLIKACFYSHHVPMLLKPRSGVALAALTILVLIAQPLPGQTSRRLEDSLRAYLQGERPGKQRVDALNRLSLLLLDTRPRESKTLAQQALALARRLRYPVGQGYAECALANCYRLENRTDSALRYGQSALHLFTVTKQASARGEMLLDLGSIYFRENKTLTIRYFKQARHLFDSLYRQHPDSLVLLDKLAACAHNLANTYQFLGRFPEALGEEMTALRLTRKTGNREKEAIFLLGVGSLYNDTKDYPAARVYAHQALSLLLPLQNWRRLSGAYRAVGKSYAGEARYDSAQAAYGQALLYALKSGYAPYVGAVRTEMAVVLARQGALGKALAAFDSVTSYYRQLPDWHALAAVQNMAAEELLAAGKAAPAIPRLEEALASAGKAGALSVKASAYKLLYQAYATVGQHQQAGVALSQHVTLKDSILSLEKNRQLDELRTQYETEQKEGQIAALRVQATLQRRVRNGAVALGGVFLFSGALFAFLWKRQRATSRKLTQALEEKAILLKEIHHRVKNNLQLIYALLNLQTRREKEPAVQLALRQGQNRIKSVAIVHERLYQTEGEGEVAFSEYVNQLATHLLEGYLADPGQVSLHIEVTPIRLPLDVAVPLGLILTELITNSLKYAFPDGREGRLGIGIQALGAEYLLQVEDDGPGLPPGLGASPVKTLGLDIVRTLTDQLGGSLTMRNLSPQGAQLTVRFPAGAR